MLFLCAITWQPTPAGLVLYGPCSMFQIKASMRSRAFGVFPTTEALIPKIDQFEETLRPAPEHGFGRCLSCKLLGCGSLFYMLAYITRTGYSRGGSPGIQDIQIRNRSRIPGADTIGRCPMRCIFAWRVQDSKC